ncbi:MAG: hydrogenase iron-sulfur subunit [Deltaproteobacteria bacterium]
MYRSSLALGHKGFLIFEDWLNKVFSPRLNPMYYLGAIAFLFTWIVFISGLYLMFVYSISVEKAYDSLQEMNWFNQLMRSLHRYASDGAMIALLVHLVREYFNDRYRRWRWVAWVTGVALILIYWGLGVTGYWMVWDQRGQLIARLSAELLDFIPIWGEPLTRAFISNDAVTNLLFIGVIFVHIAVPTIALFLLWLHVIRISRPVINPPKELLITITGLTVVLCFAYPATSVGRADLNLFAARFGIDWWYLVLYPFLASYPAWGAWALTIAGTGILTALPWFIKPGNPGKAKVVLPKCVGCELCFKDCPYEAIMMRKRTDGLPYKEEAIVVETRCASCGLCVGACDFHAIDLPDLTEEMIYKEIQQLMSFKTTEEPNILNVACGYGVNMKGLMAPDTKALKEMPNVKVLRLPCVSMLQPVMIEIAMKSGADGVFISGCQAKDCHFREGDNFIEGRLLNSRPPVLRKKAVDPTRIRAGWFSAIHSRKFLEDLRRFANDIKEDKKEVKVSVHRYIRERMTVAGIIFLAIPAALTLVFSDYPYSFYRQKDSMLMFSFKHSGKHIAEEKKLTPEELMKLPPHMRGRSAKSGKRYPVYAEVEIDGEKIISNSYTAGGLKAEGSAYAYEKIIVTPGIHKVKIQMSDTDSRDQFDYTYEQELEFKPSRQICIDFSNATKSFFIRN